MHPLPTCARSPRAFLLPLALGSASLLLLATAQHTLAQDPSPGPTPPTVVTPGLPSQADLDAARNADTPTASVVLGAAPSPGAAPAAHALPSPAGTGAAAAADLPLQPTASGGTFAQIDLSTATTTAAPTTLKAIRQAARANAATASAASTAAPALATVTLSYDASRAGSVVWVQALGGGTLSTLDENSHPITATDGFALVIGPTGTLTFSFQAPVNPNTYQVLTRLDNVKTTLSFLVPDPQAVGGTP